MTDENDCRFGGVLFFAAFLLSTQSSSDAVKGICLYPATSHKPPFEVALLLPVLKDYKSDGEARWIPGLPTRYPWL